MDEFPYVFENSFERRTIVDARVGFMDETANSLFDHVRTVGRYLALLLQRQSDGVMEIARFSYANGERAWNFVDNKKRGFWDA